MADISFETDSEVVEQATLAKKGIRAQLDLDWLQQNIRCQHRCPAHMDVPGYIRLISQGAAS